MQRFARSIASLACVLALGACAASREPVPPPVPTTSPAPAALMLGTPAARDIADRPTGAAWRRFGPTQVLVPTGPRRMLDDDPGAPRVVPFTNAEVEAR
ncbi:MAG: hypothetical protein EA356_17710 [Geminicoccaceae bacterium]|nr:MAG: hypothetical protein EA356_17710 [Geminicoccaceae bacterium]